MPKLFRAPNQDGIKSSSTKLFPEKPAAADSSLDLPSGKLRQSFGTLLINSLQEVGSPGNDNVPVAPSRKRKQVPENQTQRELRPKPTAPPPGIPVVSGSAQPSVPKPDALNRFICRSPPPLFGSPPRSSTSSVNEPLAHIRGPALLAPFHLAIARPSDLSSGSAAALDEPARQVPKPGPLDPIPDYRSMLGLGSVVRSINISFSFTERFQPSKASPSFSIGHIGSFDLLFRDDENENDVVNVVKLHAKNQVRMLQSMTFDSLVFEISLDIDGKTVTLGECNWKLKDYMNLDTQETVSGLTRAPCRVVISYNG